MSHNSSEYKICPNCGYHAVENYCAQCGQENHLHKDTFWALIAHFAGHYLHYDSKFWKTLQALWFSPGLLTTAYWEEKRMRYIPPISLYIFVSFVFFLVSSLIPDKEVKNTPVPTKTYTFGKGAKATINKADPDKAGVIQFNYDSATASGTTKQIDSAGHLGNDNFNVHVQEATIFGWDIGKAMHKRPQMSEYVLEQFKHLYPKLFFFLIPFMALMLKILFVRRKDLFYVNHVIFSLHYHAFWFSLETLRKLYLFPYGHFIFSLICFVMYVVYMVKALHNVYGVSRWRGFFYGTVIGFFYAFFFALVVAGMFLFIIWQA